MLCRDVINQLRDYIPRRTSLFNDTLDVTSMVRSGTTVTVITSEIHELITGDKVHIGGAISPIAIDVLTQVDNVASAETVSDHDLTEGYQNTISISGANEIEYNGNHTLLTVPNRRNFTYQIENGPSSPATGTLILHDMSWYNGYNGLHTIAVIDDTTFTFETEKEPFSPAQGTIVVNKSIRISGAAHIKRGIEAYTPKDTNKLWMLVVLGDVSANKSREIKNDATSVYHSGIEYRQQIITPVGIYVFIPSTGSRAGRESRDLAEEVAPLIYASLLGSKLSSYLSEPQWADVTFNGHNFFDYLGSYYIHEYIFETISYLTYDDTIGDGENVAFRDIDLSFVDGKALAAIDLDDVPL